MGGALSRNEIPSLENRWWIWIGVAIAILLIVTAILFVHHSYVKTQDKIRETSGGTKN